MHKYIFRCAFQIIVVFAAITAAIASPNAKYVCYDGAMTARVSFNADMSLAFMNSNIGLFQLKARPGQIKYGGSFSFEDETYRFTGFASEAQIYHDDFVIAWCHQTKDSIKDAALSANHRNGTWSKYEAKGEGFQIVRSRPSLLGDRIASLPQGTPVEIVENTDEFMEGFFWFKIKYDGGKQGYMWGALLCTDEENPELNATIRRCS